MYKLCVEFGQARLAVIVEDQDCVDHFELLSAPAHALQERLKERLLSFEGFQT